MQGCIFFTAKIWAFERGLGKEWSEGKRKLEKYDVWRVKENGKSVMKRMKWRKKENGKSVMTGEWRKKENWKSVMTEEWRKRDKKRENRGIHLLSKLFLLKNTIRGRSPINMKHSNFAVWLEQGYFTTKLIFKLLVNLYLFNNKKYRQDCYNIAFLFKFIKFW